MKKPAKAIAELRARVADQIEELAAVMTHTREALECVSQNPKGAAMDLADAGTTLMELHDACGNLSKLAFDIKATLEK